MSYKSEHLDFIHGVLGQLDEQIERQKSLEGNIRERARLIQTEGIAAIRKDRLDQMNSERMLQEKITELEKNIHEQSEKNNDYRAQIEENKKRKEEEIVVLNELIEKHNEKEAVMNQGRENLMMLFNQSLAKDEIKAKAMMDRINKKEANYRKGYLVERDENILNIIPLEKTADPQVEVLELKGDETEEQIEEAIGKLRNQSIQDESME